MTDIRLEELPFEFDGKRWILRCNMNVLADVQAAYEGNIASALDSDRPYESVLRFLAAMLNDYADEQGWPERYTARQLGRKLTQWMIPTEEIMGLVVRSLIPPGARTQVSETDAGTAGEEDKSPDLSGN